MTGMTARLADRMLTRLVPRVVASPGRPQVYAALAPGACATLAVVFGVAVAGKLSTAGLAEFRRAVGRLWPGPGRLSDPVRNAVATLLLAGELLTTAALAAGTVAALGPGPAWAAAPGLAGATTLTAAFTAAHAAAVARGRAVPCACFGRTRTVVGPVTLTRSGLLLVIAGTGLAVVLAAPAAPAPATAGVGVLAGAVLGLLLVGLEDLVALLRPTSVPYPSRPRS